MHSQGDYQGSGLDEASIVLRDYDPERDQAFIYSSWRNSLYYHVGENKRLPPKQFFSDASRTIGRILRSATVRIACIKDSPTVIVGYCVSTGTHLDWIYVKEDFRMKGIGSLLMPKDIETVTDSVTRIGQALLAKKNLKVRRTDGESSTGKEDPRGAPGDVGSWHPAQ